MPHPPQVLRKEGHHGLPPLPGEGRSLPCSSGADSAASRTDRWVPARMRGPQAGALGWGDCLWKWFLPCTPSYVHVHIVHTYVRAGMWACVFLPCTPGHVYVHTGMWACVCRSWPSWVEAACDCLCVQVSRSIKGVSSEEVTWVSTQKTDHIVIVVQPLSHVRLFVTPWTVARQASLSFTNSQSLLKLMSIEL